MSNPVKTLLAAGGGYAASGGSGAVAAPVIGMMARRGARQATVRNLEQLQKLAAAGADPRYIVSRYAKAAGPQATPGELSQFLVTAPRKDLIELAAKVNGMKGPNRKLAADALVLAMTGQVAPEL